MLFTQELTTEIFTHVNRNKADPLANLLKEHKNLHRRGKFNNKSFSSAMHKVIYRMTGINIVPELWVGGNTTLAVATPQLSKPTITRQSKLREAGWVSGDVGDFRWAFADYNLSVEDGIIYPEKLEVGGAFNKVRTKLLYNPDFLFSRRLTDETMIAMVLHEIGHVYTAFATYHCLYVSNVVLTEATNPKSFNPYTVTMRFKPLLTGIEERDLRATKDQKTYVKLARIISARKIAALQSLNFTDDSASEDMADMFPGHFGYIVAGKDLVNMLMPDIGLELRRIAMMVLSIGAKKSDGTYLSEYAFTRSLGASGHFRYRKMKDRMRLNLNLMANRMRLMTNISPKEQARLRDAYDKYEKDIRNLPEPSDEIKGLKPTLLDTYRSGMYLKDLDRQTEDLLDNPLWISASQKI